MNAQLTNDQFVAKMHQSLVSGALKNVTALKKSSWEKVRAGMSADQRAVYDQVDVGKINVVMGLARKMSEQDFVDFAHAPDSAVVQLSPREMELLTGGSWLGDIFIGVVCAAATAGGTVVTFGLGAPAATAVEIVGGATLSKCTHL